jgi:hypothetical protein
VGVAPTSRAIAAADVGETPTLPVSGETPLLQRRLLAADNGTK